MLSRQSFYLNAAQISKLSSNDSDINGEWVELELALCYNFRTLSNGHETDFDSNWGVGSAPPHHNH
jgi:hypothetical protein